MPIIKLVMSDLHLADGQRVLDGFGEKQQAALQGLLRAASPGGPLGRAGDVELIINGDCFDFLAVEPYTLDGRITPATALEKLEKIIPAHRPFFEALRRFISLPGRHVTFITGNHDIELCFEQVQTRIRAAILGEASGQQERVRFCATRFYRPLPDVYIEHGNHFDFWNYASGVWDEQEHPLEAITLPVGTQYIQRAAHSISVRYSYLDHFDPSVDSVRQIALLCLLDPEIIIETVQRTMRLLSYPREALADLAPGEEGIPATLFEKAMIDFAAFHQDMLAHTPGWNAVESILQAHSSDTYDAQADAIKEFFMLRDALSLPPVEAVKAILAATAYPMEESVARGMQQVLYADPMLRYAIAGHTHMLRRDALNGGSQVYLNTATWTARYALPKADEITPELVEWLRKPDANALPLRDVTQLVFAYIHAEEDGPGKASLCAWAGGEKGHYQVLV